MFRYNIIAEGNYLGYEKIRTTRHKNGKGEIIHESEKVVQQA